MHAAQRSVRNAPVKHAAGWALLSCMGRTDEGGLGKADLATDGEELVVGEGGGGVNEHEQLVALVLPLGEAVQQPERVASTVAVAVVVARCRLRPLQCH